MNPTPVAGQLDQPLPAPPDRSEPPPAPKLTKPPAVKKQVEPTYPPEAFAAGLAGDVTLTIDIDADGRVTAVAVKTAAGHGFDEAAAAAAREMEFFPAEVDGKPSPIRIEYTIHFQPRTVAADAGVPDAGEVGRRRGPAAAAATARLPLRRHASSCAVRCASAERASRSPAPTSPSFAAGRHWTAATCRPRWWGRPTTTGASRSASARPARLRVVVSDTVHESCVRDFSAAELGGPTPVEWSCFTPRARPRRSTRPASAARAEHPEETRQTLTKAELTTVPGTIGDPLRVLQNMPGVARAPFGLGLLIVRGANPTDTGVFIGGEPIPVLYHFLAGPSVFTANLIDKIDFYPGGFGVRYGRFIGGVVDVNIKSNVGRTLHGAVDINLRDSSAYVEGPVPGGVRTSFAARRSYIDALLPYLHPVAGRLDVRHRGSGLLGLSGAGREGRPGRRAGRAARLRQQRQPGGHRPGSDRRAGVELAHRLSPRDGRMGHLARRMELAPVGHLRLRRSELLDQHPRRATSATTASTGARTSAGASAPRSRCRRGSTSSSATTGRATTTCRFRATAAPSARPCRRRWSTSPARSTTRRPPSTSRRSGTPCRALRLVPGLRLDYYHVVETDKFSFDPRLAFRWELTPRLARQGRGRHLPPASQPAVPRPACTATRTWRCPGPTSIRSASSGGSPRPTS